MQFIYRWLFKKQIEKAIKYIYSEDFRESVAKWLNKELDIPVLNEVQEKRMIDAILNVMVRIIKKTFGYNENK